MASKRTKTQREKYHLQQWQLLNLLFWVHPAAKRITVKVGKKDYHAVGYDEAGATLFQYSRPDAQRHIDNPFLLFRDHLTPERLANPDFTRLNIVRLFRESELYRRIVAGECDPDIGLYAHSLDLLMRRAADELFLFCLTSRGMPGTLPPRIVLLKEDSLA